MPVIAIARCSKLPDYEAAVRQAGGDPRIVAAGDRAADVIGAVGGLLLAGGGDVQPSFYGAEPHPTFEAAEAGRDDFEIELVQRALEANLPVFAICRGVQLLNVARGGTLIQDIPSEIREALDHARHAPPHDPFALAHPVQVTAHSLLDSLRRERATDASDVNSRHHQAVKKPGEGLIVTAVAADGVIEAVEDPSRRFCIGVQWHPENFWRTGEFSGMFAAFVKACR